MTPEFLSTAEAATLAGVGTSSVKRWADEGALDCVKTAGNHRRFLRADVERFLERQKQTAPADDFSRWYSVLLDGTPFDVDAALSTARSRRDTWHGVADELGGFLTELGRRWETGRVSVLAEHVVAEQLSRGLSRISHHFPSASGAGTCLLATPAEEEHTLGLSLTELCVRERGWRTIWAGRKTPTRDVVQRIKEGDLGMVAISASTSSSDPRALSSELGQLGKACRRAGTELVFGGGGAWPERVSFGTRFFSFGAFAEHVSALAAPKRKQRGHS